jgi:hypothetical protein
MAYFKLETTSEMDVFVPRAKTAAVMKLLSDHQVGFVLLQDAFAHSHVEYDAFTFAGEKGALAETLVAKAIA